MACNEYNLQPVDMGLKNFKQDENNIKSWTPRLVIYFNDRNIYTHVVRVFQCYKIDGIEASPTDVLFGFKRTYNIDMLSGPPKILPPIWLCKNNTNTYEITIPKEVCDKEIMHINPSDFIPKYDD